MSSALEYFDWENANFDDTMQKTPFSLNFNAAYDGFKCQEYVGSSHK